MQRLLFCVVCCLCAGCFQPLDGQVSGDEAAEAEPGGGAPAAAPQAAGGPPVIPDVPARFVDKQAALADNPDLREVVTGVNAMDPLSASTQSYFALGQRVQMMNFKHQVDIMREINDRYPTFDEFAELMRVCDMEFKELKPWQMYAYDSTDGSICVLEDPEVKRARYEAAGIEYEE